jgi:hypothetical protein
MIGNATNSSREPLIGDELEQASPFSCSFHVGVTHDASYQKMYLSPVTSLVGVKVEQVDTKTQCLLRHRVAWESTKDGSDVDRFDR